MIGHCALELICFYCNLNIVLGDCTQFKTRIVDAHLLKDSNITRICITTRVNGFVNKEFMYINYSHTVFMYNIHARQNVKLILPS